MSQMPEDDFEDDGGFVNCGTQKEFREAVEDSPDDALIYLRGEDYFTVPDIDHLPHHIIATDEVVLKGGHPDLHLNLTGDADVIEEIKFDWRQVP